MADILRQNLSARFIFSKNDGRQELSNGFVAKYSKSSKVLVDSVDLLQDFLLV